MSSSSAKKLIKNLSFCVFDLETTGGNLSSDKIIEIGLIKIENLTITDRKSYLIQPEIKIPGFIQKLTSISQKDVEKSPLIEDVIGEIVDFMGDSILVAHNTSFDVPFFNSVLKRLKLPPLKNKSICTNLMTKYLIPNLMNSNLQYMSKVFDIKHKKAHRALDDAQATAGLLLTYLNIFIKKEVQKVNHLYYPRNKYELDRINFKRGYSNEKIIKRLKNIYPPYLCTIKGDNGVILFTLPCINRSEERKYIEQKLKTLKWYTVTIRLFGPFIEAFANFNNLFIKLNEETKNEIINFLWKIHLPEKDIPDYKDHQNENFTIPTKKIGDFIMANHLVPEQFIIFPISALHHKPSLIFRYPDHEKKLFQYIQSKSRRMANNKLIKTRFDFLLREFILEHLNKLKKENIDVFFFYKDFPLKDKKRFLASLNDFIKNEPHRFNYPKEYL